MWHGSLHVAWVFVPTIAQHTKEDFTFFPHTHKTKTKRTIKIKNPKKILRKPKEGKKKKTSKKK